ncbi:MAG TPA: amidohydrolase family protein [Thermomicrobiales bacterium]|jgi:predicted TIM-barrel fold metal-dependent hydrolase
MQITYRGPIVDTHMHVWKIDPPRYTLEQTLLDVSLPTMDAPIEDVLADNATAGVTHTVLVQPSTSGWNNRYVVESAVAHPSLFAAHGLIDPDSRTNAADLREWMAEGMAGFRLNMVRDRDPAWVSASRNHALWETAQERGAVINVQMHPPQAWRLLEIATRYPGVKVIVDHLGKPDITEPPPYKQFSTILALSDLPNTYVKVSALSLASRTKEYPYRDVFPWVKMLYDAFGAARLLWGTGYPGARRALPLDKELAIITQHLPFLLEDDTRWILGRTAMTIWSFATG